MRTSRWIVAFAVLSGMFSWGLTAAPASAEPPAYEIKIVGNATFYPYDGVIDGTTIQIPVQVKCPAGTSTYVPFAGMPGYFPSGRFAEPYLPAMTGPGSYGGHIPECTGEFQPATTIARGVGRNEAPSTDPLHNLRSGPATVKVALGADANVTDTKTIQILPPPGTEIVIHTDTAILQLVDGDPSFKTSIGVSFSYRCSSPFDGQRGRVAPVVSHANPTWIITCDDSWRTVPASSGIAARVGTVDFSVVLAGRTERKTITVTPPLPDAVESMSLFDSTPRTMKVAWSAPPPRQGAMGPVPDTSITGYKVGWIEASTGRGWETESPHWPLHYSPVTLTGLLPNTLYTVWVIPVNASGDGPATTRTYSTTQDVAAPPPAPPVTPPIVGPPPPIVAPPLTPPTPPIFATPPVVVPPVVVPPVVTPPPAPPAQPNVVVLPSVFSRIASRISIVATPRVRRGGAAGLSGVVTTYRGGKYVRASGLRVVLQRLVGKKWVNVAPSTSKGARFGRLHGWVNLNVRPAKTTTYRWVFAGNSTVAPSISKAVTVTVIR